MIVNSSEPVVLVGGADVNSEDLNIALSVTQSVVAADGGANHLLSVGVTPDAIYGDLDSLSAEARGQFKDRIHQIEDQDSTDFHKVLSHVRAPLCIALGFMGQRLDHTFAALHAGATHAKHRIVFLSAEEVIVVLKDRHFEISMPEGSAFSVLPIGAAHVSSTGLKWELEAADLSMTGLISSSNETVASSVSLDVQGAVAVTLPRTAFAAAIAAVRDE